MKLRKEFLILFCFPFFGFCFVLGICLVGFFFSEFIIQSNSLNLAQRADARSYRLPALDGTKI